MLHKEHALSAPSGTVLITGAAGGMGLACSQALGPRYPELLLTDREGDRLEASAERLRAAGVECYTVVCDLSDPASIAEIARAVAARGGLRALVHTAAVSPTMADWQTLITIDLVRSIELLDSLEPMIGPGTVAVCIASSAAHMGRPVPDGLAEALAEPRSERLLDRLATLDPAPDTGAAYIWAKTAIVRECEARGVTWGRRGARIVSVSPGLIDTPMGRYELEVNPAKARMTSVTPLRGEVAGRSDDLPGTSDDIARAVAFLCSDDAAFINGCDLRIDGGFIAAWRER
jgi:NAD(P)-dependent dehydrogenase (short-subunit alcohol dehydrogenase family)